MDRLTLILLAEGALLTALSTVLFARAEDPTTSRVVAGVLAALVLVVALFLMLPRRVLVPFVKAVGLCRLCAKAVK